jgi:hypothetical protein
MESSSRWLSGGLALAFVATLGTVLAGVSATGSDAVPSAQPAAVSGKRVIHSIGGCEIFPEDNWWNAKIKDRPVSRKSKRIIKAHAAGHAIHLDLGTTEEYYGIPINVVPEDQPTLPLRFGVDGEDYRDESDRGPVPIAPGARIEGWRTSAPDPDSGDRHVIVVQRGTCELTELYAAERVRDDSGVVVAWRAAAAARWDLSSNRLRPKYWTSADAAGLPILPGLLTYEEAASGRITHALRFTLPSARAAFIKPARHCGPNRGKQYPAYGMRFRLRKGFDATRYRGPARAIVKAMKRYGLMYADQGSAMYVTGTADPRWAGTLDQLRRKPIDGKHFRVVKTGKATVCR